MKKNNGRTVFIIVAAVAVVMAVSARFSKTEMPKVSTSFSFNGVNLDDFEDGDLGSIGKLFGINSEDEGTVKKISGPYVSVIYINGVISEKNKTYNHKWLVKQINKAKKDSSNKGILLVIDSPGGTVYESDDAYLELMSFKKETERPVYAYFGSLAASGGYYIGCAADEIFANRNCLTGSIGVIAGQSIDATGLMEKIGVKMTTIHAGKNKVMGSYSEPFTAEQKAIMQSIADEAYDQFTGIVAESRKMKIEEVKKLADGRIYTAAQAKKNGLVDEVVSFKRAKTLIQEELDKDVDFVECKYKYQGSLYEILNEAASFIGNPTASAYSALSESAGKCMYLYQ